MIRGNSFKLLVISTIITQSETVIRIDPPRKEAAPSKAYLKAQARIRIRTVKINSSQLMTQQGSKHSFEIVTEKRKPTELRIQQERQDKNDHVKIIVNQTLITCQLKLLHL